MRKINKIVVHCTATQQSISIQSIINYWKEVKKWKNAGYHYIVDKNGIITQLLNDEEIANGASGYNINSIHVAYIGGLCKDNKLIDTRTLLQKYNLEKIIEHLSKKYPDAYILGHYQLPNVKKACPCFDAEKEYSIYNKNYKASS